MPLFIQDLRHILEWRIDVAVVRKCDVVGEQALHDDGLAHRRDQHRFLVGEAHGLVHRTARAAWQHEAHHRDDDHQQQHRRKAERQPGADPEMP